MIPKKIKITFSVQYIGAIGKSIGAVATSQKPTILAKGFKFNRLTVSSFANNVAVAPSFNVLAFAAVIVPLNKNLNYMKFC